MPYTEVMHKWKQGELHSGSKTGPPVTNRKQAIAIMLSEKRKAAGGNQEYANPGEDEEKEYSAGPSPESKFRIKKRFGFGISKPRIGMGGM